MKIGIWISEGFNPQVGGGASYLERMLWAIDSYAFDEEVEICYVTRKNTELPFQRPVIHLPYLRRELTKKEKIQCRLSFMREKVYTAAEERRKENEHQRDIQVLKDEHIGLIVYPTQLCCEIEGFPFVAMNWDIGHWSTYAFPELCADGEYEERSAFYTNILPKALLVCCESEAGKQELLQFTNLNSEKIAIVPLFAGNCVHMAVSEKEQKEILKQYRLERERFFFYPAQFWAHKNHTNLLKAFAMFSEKHVDYKLVLVGADKGNLGYFKQMAEDLKSADKVVFPGFVPQEHINTFYKNAAALTMVTYFGPTNMPPLEAMELNCPVIATDLKGHREQLGDAAIYIDAMDWKSIAAAMEEIVSKREVYAERISKQKSKTLFTIDNALKELNKALTKAVQLRSAWAI
jgi:glycosyltransferase involved in cell wall biosynthesis